MSTRLLSIRFDTELVDYLEERAKREHRSLSNMIIDILLREKERSEGFNLTIGENYYKQTYGKEKLM